MGSVVRPPLVGRDRQVHDLGALIDSAMGRRGGLLLVSGEAGIGKTRLAEEAWRLAEGAGAQVAWATCRVESGAPPFWPWAEALRTAGHEAALPEAATASSDPDVARFQLFDAWEQAIRAAAGDRPLLIVLDDLHWADAPSLRLLAFLAPVLLRVPVLVVATHRPDEPASTLAEHLPELLRHSQHLVLGGLATADLAVLVDVGSETSVDEAALVELERRTGGNPLFVLEYVRLAEAGGSLAEVLDDGRVPSGVRAVLDGRLAAVADLEPVEVAAVVGVEFPLDLVEEVLGGPATDRLADAADRGLLRPLGPDRWMFAHPLVRDRAYEGLGVTGRARLHAAVGAALERLRDRGRDVDPAELAHHFGAAGPAVAASATVYAEEAGLAAMAMLAYEEAVVRFGEALATAGDDERRRAELHLARGDARIAIGDRDGAREDHLAAAALARARGWAEPLARAALALGSGASGFEVPLSDRDLRSLLEEALAALPPEPSPARSRLLARLSVALPFEGTGADERRAVAEAAVTMARQVGDPAALAAALAAHGDAIPGPEHVRERLDEAGEVVALARSIGDVPLELLGRRFRVVALMELGRRDEVDVEVAAYARTADAIRHPLYGWYVPLWRGALALADGRYDEAAASCQEAERIGVLARSENALMLTVSQRWEFLYLVGAFEEVAAETESMLHQWPEYAEMLRGNQAHVAALNGRLDEARATLDGVDPAAFSSGAHGAEVLGVAFYVAHATWMVGGHPIGPALTEFLLPFRDLMAIDGIGASVLCSVEHLLGQLASVDHRPEDARAHFAAARRRHLAFGASALATLSEDHALRSLRADDVPRLVREGEVWAASYTAATVRVAATKGMADLARLVAEPHREITSLELMDAVLEPDLGPVLDDEAAAAYRARVVELDVALAAADRAGDAARSQLLTDEREAIVQELSAAHGLGGRRRRPGGSAERARPAVTQRIRTAIDRLEREHPALGAHLRATIVTGTYCSYRP